MSRGHRYTTAMASPRRMWRVKKLTWPDSSTAKKGAANSQPAGLRSRQGRWRRTASRWACAAGRAGTARPRRRSRSARCERSPWREPRSPGAILTPASDALFHETFGYRAHAKQAGTGVRAQHRPDLADQHRGAPEDLPAALLKAGDLIGRVYVLHRPSVGAGLVALAGVVHHPLECAGARAHSLDRGHLSLDGEDGLDPERRADPGAGGADPTAPLEELERVDGEPHLQLAARFMEARLDLLQVGAAGGRVRRSEHHQP